jgi:mono/diheme cytochrome c family protein
MRLRHRLRAVTRPDEQGLCEIFHKHILRCVCWDWYDLTIGNSDLFIYKETMDKKVILLSALLGFGVWLAASCVNQSQNVQPPLPDAAMAKSADTPIETLGRGYSLYQTQCAQCHERKMPKDMRVDEWHTIVPGMAWNAGLTKADEKAVEAYLVAASKRLNPEQR